MKKLLFLSFIAIMISSCKSSKIDTAQNKSLNQADKILSKTLEAHGGNKYSTAHYEFAFRNKKYTFKNEGQTFKYTVSSEKDGIEIYDVLNNKGITRTINGEKQSLTPKQKSSFTGSLNSVIYFATLPYKLIDPAVNTKYIGATDIKGKAYEIVQITFDEEGGGNDHDDTFHYWINKETNVIDYLAYNYKVGKGGVRFRSAYNSRNVEGIIFQDYVNYKAEVGTPLINLPKLFEQDKLKKLSVIETENIRKL